MIYLQITLLMFNAGFFVRHFFRQDILLSIIFALATSGSFVGILQEMKAL